VLLLMVGVNFHVSVSKGILARNFDVPIGRAACEASSAQWNL
jgi:hypothetical protein